MVDFIDIFMDSFFDTLHLFPFLLIAYFVLEYIEHKAEKKMMATIKKSRQYGPFWGGLLGLLPHCTFSAIASSFFATKVITVGTLFAVYLATSDEMIAIFLSEGVGISFLVKLMSIKLLFAIFWGFLIDYVLKSKKETKQLKIKEFCHCTHCHCHDNFLMSAFWHTVTISLWIFVVMFIFSSITELVGEDRIASILSNDAFYVKFITAGVGLIPSCASSVILSKLYLLGTISFSSLMSGLFVEAGAGLIVLFKMNKTLKENIKIVLGLYIISVISSFILSFFGV